MTAITQITSNASADNSLAARFNALNGWQRLWVFLSVPLVLFSLSGVPAMIWVEFEMGLGWLVAGFGFSAFMYAFGWGIAWIRRGFAGT